MDDGLEQLLQNIFLTIIRNGFTEKKSDFIVKFNFPRYMRVEGTNINDLQNEALNEEGHHISIEKGTNIDLRIKMMVTKVM